ncbi:hypothetical protein [Flavobacterium sp. CAU 1735]
MIHDSYRWIVVAIIMLMIKRLTYTGIGRFFQMGNKIGNTNVSDTIF